MAKSPCKKGQKYSICGKSPCKYDSLTKPRKRRAKGSPKGSEKTVAIKGSPKAKTLWMRWLWAFHCENKQVNKGDKYGDSMKKAGVAYKAAAFLETLGKTPTDVSLHAYAKKVL